MPILGLQNSASGSAPYSKFDRWSLDFDGSDEYLDAGIGLGTTIGDNYAGSLSVSIWFKADGITGGLFQVGAHNHGDFSVRLHDNKIKVGVNNAGYDWHYAFTDTTNWHHLVAILDRANTTVVLYVDGVSVGALDGTPAFPAASTLDMDATSTWIGRVYNAYHNGKISDVAFYTSALSAAEVTTIYNNGSGYPHSTGVAKSSLVGWWRMGDGASDKGSDSDGANFVGDGANSLALGTELTTDPNFETDVANDTAGTYWTTGDGWAITGGKAVASSTTNSVLRSAILTVSQVYKVTYTVSDYTSGKVKVLCGSNGGTAIAAAGTYTEYLRANTTHFSITGVGGNDFTGAISSVSVKAIGSINGGLMVNMESGDFNEDAP